MKKVGYFFFAFVPFLAVQAIQIVALCFMIGSSVITESLVGTQPVSIPEYKRQTKHPLALRLTLI